MIPARCDAGDQLLDEIQLVHHLGEVVAGLGGLAEGERSGSRSVMSLASRLEVSRIRSALLINTRLPRVARPGLTEWHPQQLGGLDPSTMTSLAMIQPRIAPTLFQPSRLVAADACTVQSEALTIDHVFSPAARRRPDR